MSDILILSIYDGGYKASIGYDGEVFDLINIDKETCIYDEDYNFMKMNNLAIMLSNLYEEYIKDNKWYNTTNKNILLSELLHLFKVDTIIICEDGDLEYFENRRVF